MITNRGGVWRALWAALLCLTVARSAWALPSEVGEWRSDREDRIPFTLSASSRDVGRWTCRVYTRKAPRGSVEVNLMEGSGPGPLRVPDAVGSYDVFLDAQAEYRVLEVAGHRAILELQSLLPAALVVSVGERTLTLEGFVTEGELTGLAARLVKILE